MDYTSGHTIFVKLWGNSTINLCQSGTVGDCAEPGFYVIDRNGTDQDGATFALPNPDPTNSARRRTRSSCVAWASPESTRT